MTKSSIVMVSLLLTGLAGSEPAPPVRSATARVAWANAVSAKDERLAGAAAEAGLAEVMFGQLAQKKASRAEVRDFGAQMVRDHGMANKELASWAQSVGVALPKKLNAKHQADWNKLSKLSGVAFDQAYMQGQVRDHKVAQALHRKGQEQADNGDLKNFFAKNTPHIDHHLQMAEAIWKDLK